MYYDGWDLIQEGPQSSIADRVYVHGARTDEVVAQITPANNWIRYFHYDANGNCTLQTDGWGNLVEQYDYDAFGFPYFYDAWGNNIGYSPWGNRMLFTGREWLRDLKLYDYRNRLYNPELGRFMQPDPKEFAAGDYNLYRYCHNDPVNHSDPLGLEFYDLGWFPQFLVSGGDDYGITQPKFQWQGLLTPVSGGFRLSVSRVDESVHSLAATHGKDGQRTYVRSEHDKTRTINHEGDHRHHEGAWYRNNEKGLLRTLNKDSTVYKDKKEADKGVNRIIGNFRKEFDRQEHDHTGPNWPNYKQPRDEHP
jgi:RHS repeat-associated protein